MHKSIKDKLLPWKALIFNVLFFLTIPSYACTIFSGVDCNGHVWNANNEDGPKGISNFINVTFI